MGVGIIDPGLYRRYIDLRAGLRWQRQHLRRILPYLIARRWSLPPTRFVIFGHARSGTTLLVSLLDSLANIHCDSELLNRWVPLPRAQILAHAAAASAPVYGCKILAYQVARLWPPRRRDNLLRWLAGQGFRIIYLRRRDLLMQVVSQVRALRFGFHRGVGEPVSATPISIDPAEAIHWLEINERLYQQAQHWLGTIPHLKLTYKDHLLSPAQHAQTVGRICRYLGLEPAPPSSAYVKLTPSDPGRAVANLAELRAVLARTRWADAVAEHDGQCA